ncbi:MAG: hypothetical protein PHZ00_06910 [Candidatus Peribacteraceae bacterium]|nr:hypothetical protein [Candidatus Peribacteraceae bacterium]
MASKPSMQDPETMASTDTSKDTAGNTTETDEQSDARDGGDAVDDTVGRSERSGPWNDSPRKVKQVWGEDVTDDC